ncbi:hypothetical protein ACTZSK_05675, partial [Klebsiella pneumoniae]
KIGPDPRNFNQRVSLGRNDLLIRTFPKWFFILNLDVCAKFIIFLYSNTLFYLWLVVVNFMK